MIRVLFLTRSLGNGGAERQLVSLVRTMDKNIFDITLAVFYPGGPRWDDVAAIPGVGLVSLNKRGRWDATGVLRSALRLARKVQPHIVYGFRSTGNLLSLALARAARAKLVWGIRRSTKALPLKDLPALGLYYAGALFSYYADRVVYNSACGKELHLAHGYCARKAVVISNGFDTTHFRPDAEARNRQRLAWGVEIGRP